ncbi:hypothetical protein ACMFMG_002982 [Clarireedia jacksonii]
MKSVITLLSFLLLPTLLLASSLSAPTAKATATATATFTTIPSAARFFSSHRNGTSTSNLYPSRTTDFQPNPVITAAPTAQDIELQQKYHLTTYWSCVTIQTYVHCGWHNPLLPGGTEIAGAPCGRCGAGRARPVVAAAGVVAAVWGVL